MRTISVLAAGVSLAFSLQAIDIQADSHSPEWSSRNSAAVVAMHQRDYANAVQLFGDCVRFSQSRDERVTSLASYGIALSRVNRNSDAKVALERALSEAGPRADRGAISLNLAAVERNLGDYQGAENILRSEIADSSVSPAERAALMVNLADILREQVREGEASDLLREAGELTGLSPDQRLGVLVEAAELTRDMRHWDTSVALWNRIGAIAESRHSTELQASVAGGLGETWFAFGNLARAEPLLRRSLQLMRNEPGVSPIQVASALALMARLYVAEDKLALAAEALDEAIAKDEDALGLAHPQVAMLLEVRADILSRRGETQPARDCLERARLIMSAHFGPESPAVAGVSAMLGDVEQRANRPAVAVGLYEVAMTLLRKAGGDGVKFGAAIEARYAAAVKAAKRQGGVYANAFAARE